MNGGPVIAGVVARCERLGIPCMVVGSFASSAHGIPRTTMDIDVVIDPDRAQLEALIATFEPERYYVDGDAARDAYRRRGMFNVVDLTSGWKVDLIVCKATAHARTELGRRTVRTVAGVPAPVASAEDVIIAKLSWARDSRSAKQLGDIAGIVRVSGDQLDRAYLARWIDELALGDLWAEASALAAAP